MSKQENVHPELCGAVDLFTIRTCRNLDEPNRYTGRLSWTPMYSVINPTAHNGEHNIDAPPLPLRIQ